MPAPFKKGLDYWPKSINLARDKRFRKPRIMYGSVAISVYEALLDQLYGEEGYYIDYSDKYDVIYGVLDELQGKHQPTAETVEEIIECLVACGLFSGDQFKHKTITSHRAQCVYYSATVTRKAIDIDFSKWLLTEAEMKKLSSKNIILQNFMNRPINGVNHLINPKKESINPQSKVKESKVDDDDKGSSFYDFLEDFTDTFFVPNRIQKENLEALYERHGALNMFEALEETGKRNVKDPIAYMQKVLRTLELGGMA